jgi:hypothetical protein
VTPERFQNAVRAFFGILGEVTKAVCKDGPRVQWRIQAKAGSNLIGVFPVPGFNPATIGIINDAILSGWDGLEREAEQPPFFSDAAIRHARELAEVVGRDRKNDTKIRLWVTKKPILVTPKVQAHANELLGENYEDYGSIEGKLQTVSERGGYKVIVTEPLWDRAITCVINQEQLNQALDLFGKRVEVHGYIKYRIDGTPTSIRVEEIIQFPPRSEIPDFKSVKGIFGRAA